jgi:WD40 repeat protein
VKPSVYQRDRLFYAGHIDPVTCLAFSPDGNRIASSSIDKTVRVWDVSTGVCVMILEGHRSGVLAVAYSKRGTFIASGGKDMRIRLWDANSGVTVSVIEGT